MIGTHKCGSQEIVGADLVCVSYTISGWEKHDSGAIIPMYSGDSEVYWDSYHPEDPLKPFFCQGCDAYCDESEIVFAEETEVVE